MKDRAAHRARLGVRLANGAPPPARSAVTTGFEGGCVKIEDLLGKHVRYKGEEAHVVEGHFDDQPSVVLSIRGTSGVPRRNVVVPESEWDQIEILS